MFTEQGEFTRSLGVGFMYRCYGLTMDGEGRVVTLNSNTGIGGCGKLTALGQTDVFYLDIPTGAVVKRVELEDILGEHQKKSDCRFLTWVKEKLYIVDMGLSRVYCIQEEKVSCISGSNLGKLRDPVALLVDTAGTVLVVESKNNRLQIIRDDGTFYGHVKVDTPLNRPSRICLDQVQKKLYVSNFAGQSVVCYQFR